MDHSSDAGKTIYVGGLPASGGWTPESVMQHFSTFGDIVNVSAPGLAERARPGENRSRGYAFLTFADSRDAMDAIDNYHLNTFLGKTITVRVANKADTQQQSASNTRNNQAIWHSEEWLLQNEARTDQQDAVHGTGQQTEPVT